MIEVNFAENGVDPDAFEIRLNGKKIGEMIVARTEDKLIVYHTEVDQEQERNGYAMMMLEKMVALARLHSLQVVPMCAYVHGRFLANPERYSDIWNASRS